MTAALSDRWQQNPSDPKRMLERICRRSWQMLRPGLEGSLDQGWLVGVSGGPDSMALWRVASALGQEHGFRVEAACIDHGLRPGSSREAALVRGAAVHMRTPCHVLAVKIGCDGSGPEAAARAVRYRALEGLRRARGLAYLAVGHTLDDQAETVLMRLLGGSGLCGLAAMQPVAGRVLRPLLWARRRLTVALSGAMGGALVDDEHNSDPSFLRPRLRQQLLPQIAKDFGDVVPRLAALADEAAELNQLGDALLGPRLSTSAVPGLTTAGRQQIAELPPVLRRRWLLSALDAVGAHPRRARASLRRFAELLPGTRPFQLHLAGATVEVDRLEINIKAGARPRPRGTCVLGCGQGVERVYYS